MIAQCAMTNLSFSAICSNFDQIVLNQSHQLQSKQTCLNCCGEYLRNTFDQTGVKLVINWCQYKKARGPRALNFFAATSERQKSFKIFLNIAIPDIFLFIFVFSSVVRKQIMFFEKIADGWIRTRVLWWLKLPLCQLCHCHCPELFLSQMKRVIKIIET